MSDFTTRARETADREAAALYPTGLPVPEINRSRRLRQKAYRKGFTTAVSRLPSEEEIAAELMRRNPDYRDHVPTESEIDWYTRDARAVRELIEKKMLGATTDQGK